MSPIPTLNKLPPNPSFSDISIKINQLVNEITNLLLNLDSLNVVSLTADNIDAGTIDAGVVTIRSNLNGGAYIRIDGNGMVINDGTRDVFIADANGNVTMTSATIQSALGYPKVTMNPLSNLFGAYLNALTGIAIDPDLTGTPTLVFEDGGTTRALMSYISSYGILFQTLSGRMTINAATHIDLNPSGYVYFDSWNKLFNDTTGQTLQDALNSINSNISSLYSLYGSLDARVTALEGA